MTATVKRPAEEARSSQTQSNDPMLAVLTDESIHDAVFRNRRIEAVWLNGYEAGFIAGGDSQLLSNEQAADGAARRFLALTELDVDIRRIMKSTREFIDVKAARDEQRQQVA